MLTFATAPRSLGLGMCMGLGSLANLACTDDTNEMPATSMVMDAGRDRSIDQGIQPDSAVVSPIDSSRDARSEIRGIPEGFTVSDNFITLPCHFPGDIDVIGSLLYGTCTTGGPGDDNHIFRADLNSTVRPIPTEVAVDLPEESGLNINQLIPLSADSAVATTAVVTANDRFYEVDLNNGTFQERAYPAGHNSGAGGIRVADRFFLATSNFNGSGFDPGGLHRYDVANDRLDFDPDAGANKIRSFATSGLNTTAIARLSSARLLIVNSGEFNDGSEAVIDTFNVQSEEIENLTVTTADGGTKPIAPIRIADFTAQVTGEAAIFGDTNGNLNILGSAAFSNMTPFAGQLLFINLGTAAVDRLDVPNTLFHSSVKVDDSRQVAYVSDFNAGTVSVINLQERTVIQSLQIFSGEAGPSELYQGQLIQAGPYQAALVEPQ